MRISIFLPFCFLAIGVPFVNATPSPDLRSTGLRHKDLFGPNKSFPYFNQAIPLAANAPAQFDFGFATLLAECSYLIYIKDPDFISDTLEKATFRNTRFFDVNGTFAFLAENDNHIILVFRGSETGNRQDYLTDARIVQKPFGARGTAHGGFIKALAEVETDINQAIEKIQKDKKRPLWIAGHSLGGALATLYGIKYPEGVSGIYTFGAPRIGGKKFAKNANQTSPSLYRVVHDNDLIPRLPTPPFYRHTGSTYFLASSGKLLIDPPASKKWESRFNGHGKFLKKLYSEYWSKGDFKAIPSDYFADHSPRLYAEVLIQLATADQRGKN